MSEKLLSMHLTSRLTVTRRVSGSYTRKPF